MTHYDLDKGHWVLDHDGHSQDVGVIDPNATDATLITELATYPVIFESKFDRSHLHTEAAVRRGCRSPRRAVAE